MRYRERLQILKYILLPAAGMIFLLLYVRAASADVVYSDYFRLIHEYLPDVRDLSKLLVPDILTRIPATFLARLVNVSSFGYSVTFDRALCLLGMLDMAVCVSVYMYRKDIRIGWQIVVWIVLFSLSKWEILLNGTAWAHAVSFGLFFAGYLILDMVWTGEASVRQEFIICALPLAALLFAGEYIVSFVCTLMLICFLGTLTGGANSWAGRRREQTIFRHVAAASALSLGLYIFSRHFAVWEHAGATEMSLRELISTAPSFLPRLFIKSFAGAVVGQETLFAFFPDGSPLPDALIFCLGLFVMGAYAFAFVLYFQDDMFERTIFPLVLMISGFANHVLVTAARWIFLNENYGLSSRYSLQFMVGILGIMLVFAMYGRQQRSYRRPVLKKIKMHQAAAVVIALLIVLGNMYTTCREIRKAEYREANYERMAAVMLDYEDYSEEELTKLLEWHKDPAILYSALEILKVNKLNVFGRPRFE